MQWICLWVIGIGVLGVFAWVMQGERKENFDMSRLGLLTLGIALISIAALRPKSFKWGDVQLVGLAERVEQATADAKDATARANESQKLAIETTAFLIWNHGRWGMGGPFQEHMARKFLEEVYGDKAKQVANHFQHLGIFATPPDELRRVPKSPLPSGVRSPFLERFAAEVKDMQKLNEENLKQN